MALRFNCRAKERPVSSESDKLPALDCSYSYFEKGSSLNVGCIFQSHFRHQHRFTDA